MSVTSHHSRGSRGGVYRKVANTSQVDESLFGERHAVKARKSREAVSRSKILSLTGKQTLGRGGGGGGGDSGATPSVTVVSASDVARMKRAAVIKTAADLKREKMEREVSNVERQQKARARKDRIMALEAERKKAIPLTQLQKEKAEEDARVLQRAGALRKEALDDVKSMNSYAEYAKTVTIRKKQLAEKEERLAREKEAERIRDLEMEIERLEMVKMYRDREVAQRKGLIDARQYIEVQIKEREQEREAAAAALREEQIRIKEEAKRAEEEARAKNAAAVERKALQREEVLRANEAAIKAKEVAKLREVEEDRKIAAYVAAEEEKRRKKEEEEAERAAAKELELAKLRAQQSKLADKQAEIDALRARRAFEAGQREARRKDMEEARKRAALQEDLIRARKEQQEQKELMIALEIQRERDEFDRNQAVRNEWMTKEKAADDHVRRKNLAHKDGILADIDSRAALRREMREKELAEGQMHRVKLEEDLEEVRRIRDAKVQALKDAGVDDLYTVEIAKFDPADMVAKDFKLGGRVPSKH